jgi:hypothetical protein
MLKILSQRQTFYNKLCVYGIKVGNYKLKMFVPSKSIPEIRNKTVIF